MLVKLGFEEVAGAVVMGKFVGNNVVRSEVVGLAVVGTSVAAGPAVVSSTADPVVFWFCLFIFFKYV